MLCYNSTLLVGQVNDNNTLAMNAKKSLVDPEGIPNIYILPENQNKLKGVRRKIK